MSESQKWFIFAGLTATGVLLYLLAPVLTPFLMASILAYIGDPLVDRLENLGVSRTLSVIIVFAVLSLAGLLLLLILVPMLERQIALLVSKLPAYAEWFQNKALPAMSKLLGIDATQLDFAALKKYAQEAGGMVGGIFAALSRSGLTVLGWLANLVLIPVVTFYLLRDWDILVARINELLPRRIEPAVARLARASDEVLGAFLRGQLLVMLGLGSIYTVGLWLVGLDLALLLGMVAGLVSFVPYLGFIVGILAAGTAALMQFQDLTHLLAVVGVFGVGQVVEGMLLTPLLVGERIGLHPVAVIFAVLAGGQLFGFFGILLALPVAAVVMVLLRFAHEHYLKSGLYTDKAAADEAR